MLISTATQEDLEAAWWRAVSEFDIITLACMMEQRVVDPGLVNRMSRNAIGEILVHPLLSNERAEALVEILLAGGCPADCDRPRAFGALTLAAPTRSLAIIKMLREHGASIHDDAHGAYLLHDACRNPDPWVALYLLAQGARPDLVRQHDQSTLLIAAVRANNRELVEVLIQRGLPLDHQDHDGNTAAMHAAKHGFLRHDYKMLVALAAAGANLERRNFDQERIRDILNRTPGALVEFEAELLQATTQSAGSKDGQGEQGSGSPPRRL